MASPALPFSPLLVVLGLLAVVMAPLTTLVVSITVRGLKLPPRQDTYARAAACCFLPFAVSLLAGWQDMLEWDIFPALSWPVAIALLIYFFRADLVEWAATVVAAAGAIFISILLFVLANQLITSVTGPLYADMLPNGPWKALATGHSPEPKPVKSSAGGTIVKVPDTQEVALGPSEPPATGPAVPSATRSGEPPVAVGNPVGQPETRAVSAAPLKIPDSSFAKFIEPGDFRGVSAVIVPPAGGSTFLTVKNNDNATEVQRWSLNPPPTNDLLTKKEHLADSPLYYAKKPAVFALSPKGDAIVALSFFPTRKIEIFPLDNKTPKRTIPMDGVGPAETVGTLPGFLDATHFTVRWDYNGKTVLQVFSCPAGAETRTPLTFDITIPDPQAIAISPNGKTLAAFGFVPGSSRSQIELFNMDNGQLLRRINVSELSVRHLGMAFSPDNTQIAIYAAIADLPTVISFKIATGDIAMQNLLSQTPLDKNSPVTPACLGLRPLRPGAPAQRQRLPRRLHRQEIRFLRLSRHPHRPVPGGPAPSPSLCRIPTIRHTSFSPNSTTANYGSWPVNPNRRSQKKNVKIGARARAVDVLLLRILS